jgi:hypothetical protein
MLVQFHSKIHGPYSIERIPLQFIYGVPCTQNLWMPIRIVVYKEIKGKHNPYTQQAWALHFPLQYNLLHITVGVWYDLFQFSDVIDPLWTDN